MVASVEKGFSEDQPMFKIPDVPKSSRRFCFLFELSILKRESECSYLKDYQRMHLAPSSKVESMTIVNGESNSFTTVRRNYSLRRT